MGMRKKMWSPVVDCQPASQPVHSRYREKGRERVSRKSLSCSVGPRPPELRSSKSLGTCLVTVTVTVTVAGSRTLSSTSLCRCWKIGIDFWCSPKWLLPPSPRPQSLFDSSNWLYLFTTSKGYATSGGHEILLLTRNCFRVEGKGK